MKKKIQFLILLCACIVGGLTFGAVTEQHLNAQDAQDAQYVLASCEEDECEGGTQCEPNPGEQTSCDMTGPYSCKSKGCGSDIEIK